MRSGALGTMDKALFLDRDGVICESFGKYLLRWEQFRLMPGIQELINASRTKGYRVVVVTNQPQIARGLLTLPVLEDIHRKMLEVVSGIDAIYFCPHIDEDGCECRKPKPGMFLQASRDMDIDLSRSLFVGDMDKDVGAGRAAGVRTVFIKNQFNEKDESVSKPEITVSNLAEVTRFLA